MPLLHEAASVRPAEVSGYECGNGNQESDMGRYDHYDEPYIIVERREVGGGAGALFLGLAIGAGLALLFAPKSGEETRRDIERQARRARERASEFADEFSNNVSDTLDQARHEVEDRLDAARDAMEVRRRQVARAVEAGRAAAQQAREELEQRIAEGKVAYEAGVAAARSQSSAARGGSTADGEADFPDLPDDAEA